MVDEEPESDLRDATADLLRGEVAAMNVENFSCGHGANW